MEAKGWLTSSEKDVDLILPEYPDFLLKEIKALDENNHKRKGGDHKDQDGKHLFK